MIQDKLVKKIFSRIDNVPYKDKVFIQELLEHSEWGTALETLCSVIEQDKINISEETFIQIKLVCNMMNLDDFFGEVSNI